MSGCGRDNQVRTTQVFRLLNDAQQGRKVDLPNVQSVLPFLGLYSLVILLPTELDRLHIISHHLPALSILQDDGFVLAPPDTEPDAPGAARIFDALSMTEKQPETKSAVSYQIPLSAAHAEFAHRRYWRVPAKPEVMLMMLLERIRHVTESACEEVNHARVICGILMINKAGVEVSRRPSEGGGGGAGDGEGVTKNILLTSHHGKRRVGDSRRILALQGLEHRRRRGVRMRGQDQDVERRPD